jgi:1,4-dihydroxy-2-naphthoate octaprenyltransferase
MPTSLGFTVITVLYVVAAFASLYLAITKVWSWWLALLSAVVLLAVASMMAGLWKLTDSAPTARGTPAQCSTVPHGELRGPSAIAA